MNSFADILLVRLPRGELSSLTDGLRAYDELDRPEMVVIVDHFLDPAVHALVRMGLRRVIEEQDLSSWLPESGALLQCMARGRRAERRLRESTHSWIDRPWPAAKRMPRLFEAEQRFRETYIRAVLGVAGSRREAAEVAGVPYRTFCQIVASAGIDATYQRDERVPAERL